MKVFALLLFIGFIGYGQTGPKLKQNVILGDTSKVVTTYSVLGKADSTNCRHQAKMSCSVYGCGCGYCMDCGKRLKE